MKVSKLVVSTSLLFMIGCNSFSILPSFAKKQKDIPSKPSRTFDEMEDLKGNIGVIVDISQEAYSVGVDAHSYESESLLKSAKVLQTVSGLPTDQIDWRVKEELGDLHANILKNEERYRIERAKWEREIASYANETTYLKNENGKLSSSLAYWKWWFYFCLIALLLLCFFFPTVGIPLVRFLVGRVKKTGEVALAEASSAMKNQFGQVVDAIEEFKRENPNESKKLLESLQKKTDNTTRKVINEVKR